MKKCKIGKRVIGILLGAELALAQFILPSSVYMASAAGSDDAYNTKTIYEWHLAGENKDFPPLGEDRACLLCWARNGVAYCAGNSITEGKIQGRVMSSDPYLDSCLLQYDSDTNKQSWATGFRTTTTKDAWRIKTTGYDSDQNSIPNVEFRTANGKLLQDTWSGLLSEGFELSGSYSEYSYAYTFTTITKDAPIGVRQQQGDNTANVDGTKVIFYLNTDGVLLDVFMEIDGGTLFADCRTDTWDDGDDDNLFRIYVCEEKVYPAIRKEYRVRSGTTFQLKNDAYLDDDVPLIIEPGAVVTLDGKFYNNGRIENYGTLILHEGATMMCHDPQTRTGSSITNYGSGTTYIDENGVQQGKGEGNLIVMDGAKILLQNAENKGGNYTGPTLSFKEGSTFVNYGLVSSPFRTVFEGCRIQMKEGSDFISGVNFYKKLGVLEQITAQDMEDFGAVALPTSGVSFLPSVNYLDSYGTWHNLNCSLEDQNVILKKKK